MKSKLLFVTLLLLSFVMTSCDEITYVNTSEFKLEIFNNNISIIGFNDDFYTQDLVIEEKVTYYCEKHKKYETKYVYEVSERSFQNKDLKSVTFKETEKSEFREVLDYAFADNKVLTTVNLPHTILHIGDYAFLNNSSLETIDLHNVKILGESVFLNNSNLELISLGNDVQSIGDNAFENCHDNLEISIGNPSPPKIGDDIFKGVENFKILVPENLLVTYKNAEGWSNYSSHIFAQ